MVDSSRKKAADMFEEVTTMRAPDPTDAFTTFVLDRVFGEVWTRPGLSRRDRRWISLTSVVSSASPTAVEVHMSSALNSGDITVDELREFVLHYSIYNGMPKATVAKAALDKLVSSLE